jgi:hypothetical protein
LYSAAMFMQTTEAWITELWWLYFTLIVNHLQVRYDYYLSLSIMCSKQWSCPLMYASTLFDWINSEETLLEIVKWSCPLMYIL